MCRQRPTLYGVEVDKRATIEDIMAAAAPLAGLSEEEEFLPLNIAGNRHCETLRNVKPLVVIPPNTKVSNEGLRAEGRPDRLLIGTD